MSRILGGQALFSILSGTLMSDISLGLHVGVNRSTKKLTSSLQKFMHILVCFIPIIFAMKPKQPYNTLFT